MCTCEHCGLKTESISVLGQHMRVAHDSDNILNNIGYASDFEAYMNIDPAIKEQLDRIERLLTELRDKK